jgi:hypothetical protein
MADARTTVEVRRAATSFACLAVGMMLATTAAHAHSLSPSLLAVAERPGGGVDVRWKTPLLRIPGADLRPALPRDCSATTAPELREESDTVTATWSIDCGAKGLVGRNFGVEGLAASKTDALLHIELADGRVIDTVLRSREPTFVVPEREDLFTVAPRYGELGIDHIATGFDHLLFVLGLFLLAPTFRVLAVTVTAFTLGHSLTLTLAVLDVTRFPAAPVETLIALSIFVLAVELARPGTTATAIRRRPWSMAALFGLLHGLGFAAMLREIGLPTGAIPLALFSFNVGIELGQLVFVLVLLVGRAAIRATTLTIAARARPVVVYAMGSLAAYWMIERSLPLWTAGRQWLVGN